MEGSLTRKAVSNGGTEIEYYVSNEVGKQASLVVSMGVWEPATRALPLITRLAGRHCIALSYRGRGGSASPESGYDWPDHASDLAAVLTNEPLSRPVFLGFSKGVSYMLGYLSTHPEQARGVIIVDHPAVHIRPDDGYANYWAERRYNGLRLGDYISGRALAGIERESTQRDFYSDLTRLACPVWLFRGTCATADIPSGITDDDVVRFRASVRHLEVIDFELSGHMIFDEELGKAVCEVGRALANVDADCPQPDASGGQ